MRMLLERVVAQLGDTDIGEITAWVERGWVRPLDAEAGAAPNQRPGDWVFEEADLARLRLVRDLTHGMEVAPDLVPLVLSLLDQVYGLRATLRGLSEAIAELPEAAQAQLRQRLGVRPD